MWVGGRTDGGDKQKDTVRTTVLDASIHPIPPHVPFTLPQPNLSIHTYRPQRLNALSEGMGESLLRLADYLAAAPADRVRACIVYGGTRAFSTGRDLKVS